MNGWRGWGGEEGPSPVKISFAIGAALGFLVLGWMLLARPGEENVSSSGFSDGGAGMSSSPFGRDRRSQTGLAMAGSSSASAAAPASVKTEAVPGPSGVPAPGAAVAPGSTAAGSPATETSGATAPPDQKELAAAGVPTDEAGLKRLGSDGGLLTDAIARLLDHPRILRALMDNKLVVNALMDREDSRRNCSDAGALQAGLSSPSAGAFESQMMPLVSRILSKPDAVAALAGSEMGSRLMSCPSVHALATNPAGLMAIATANPQALSMVSDPRVAQALSSTAQGTSLLGGVQSSWSSAGH